jgi:hypothetical protein
MFTDCHLHSRWSRILSGAALAAALALFNPAGAQAAGIWGWIESLLADRVAAVTVATTTPRHTTRAKEVVCPPTGCPKPQTTQGSSTDPDGKP